MPIYDAIGQSYAYSRLPDVRIVDSVVHLLALTPGSIIADIGAGTGGYSRMLAERGFHIYAVEPSAVMRSHATPHPRVQWLSDYAEAITLPNNAVDAVICLLAIHHFSELKKAFYEMNRIAKKKVSILTFDVIASKSFWLYDYFPFIREYDKQVFSSLKNIISLLEEITQRVVDVHPFMLPPDLSDMFLAAGWRKPEIYLNAQVRASMSAFALANPNAVQTGINLLQTDLNYGQWNAKYGQLKQLNQLDVGYRFLCVKK
ncbi:class I SAM-dependent methyltransferase [Gloeocapsopsis sp. IPPAS B-1203]|uniref:class I SAM-dependent methyltransferase n=1 Tax=Gloeocapsopsis sp. IPPAS B-1203 TaxID=2049454 RepID=UPI000C17AE05|nr:class I SAM-dependent methyltransferase [Gloeocapsopsis sp. IPPAS B-1203]PIG92001.1 SAM-dependent methyltransferase [Gloeocapsopsis sp. IPPAS B-1203]